MKEIFRFVTTLSFSTLCFFANCQEKPEIWTLETCINYAITNNIQIQKSRITYQSGLEDTKQAQAQYIPSLSFSTSQTFSHRQSADSGQDNNNYAGNYSLNSSWTLFDGGERSLNLKQSRVDNSIQELSIAEAEDNIELQITRTYLQLLYTYENIKINENAVKVSETEKNRANELLKAGSISKSDLAQLESQYSSDKYQLIVSKTNFENQKLQLKQLLELGINEDMQIVYPEIRDQDVIQMLPSKEDVYYTALQFLPQIRSKELGIERAKIEKNKAIAGYYPNISLSASVNSGNVSGSSRSFFYQIENNFNQNIGFNLSIPILNNRQTKTAVQKAKLQISTYELELIEAEKDILSNVESIYQDAVSSQNQYTASLEKVKAVEASNLLIQEQFRLGMKNTLELLTQKNNLLTAQQEMLQAKYVTVMNIQLLNFYQNKPIRLN